LVCHAAWRAAVVLKFPNLEKIITAFDQSGNDALRKKSVREPADSRAVILIKTISFILNLILAVPPVLKSRRNRPCRVACFLL
jgi:hypothetical protein